MIGSCCFEIIVSCVGLNALWTKSYDDFKFYSYFVKHLTFARILINVVCVFPYINKTCQINPTWTGDIDMTYFFICNICQLAFVTLRFINLMVLVCVASDLAEKVLQASGDIVNQVIQDA